LFRENNIDTENVNYFTRPFTPEKLRALILKIGIAPFDVLRKGELKDSPLTKESPLDEIVAAIIENPKLLQRPIVEAGDKALIARPIERALELI
jgi:arsenate reductase